MEITKTEVEGVVRKEAVVLITRIYENQKVQINQLDSIYEALAIAAIHDLFWEVKVKAIAFWHCVIKRQLQDQGVIDGTFPSVTFSKENKKIVTLTQKEITLRLTKVLVKLSTFGCLGVLLASLEDHDDVLVVKKGVEVIESLTEFLDKYKYWEETQEHSHSVHRQTTNQSTSANASQVKRVKMTNVSNEVEIEAEMNNIEVDMPNSDDVIQSIVSAQDISLLSKAYENKLKVDPDDTFQHEPIEHEEHFKSFRQITPDIFLAKIKRTNLTDLLKTRTDWLAQTESFTSLLNDMSYSLQAHELHDADCY